MAAGSQRTFPSCIGGLCGPVTHAVLWDWCEQRLAPLGWSGGPGGGVALFRRIVGDRTHFVVINTGRLPGELVRDYSVNYTISDAD
jgi:hypothetical protein